MSGFEVVGVVLGGLPLIISAAEHYKNGFEPFVKWHQYKRQFRSFINDVDIERQMFEALVDRILQYTDLSAEEKQMLLMGQDLDGWCRSETDKALRQRLGESFAACMYLLGAMKDDLSKLQAMMSLKDGSIDWAKPGEDKWNYQRKRISHSFSKKGSETVASLGKKNRKLRELLDILDLKAAGGKNVQRKAILKDTTWARIFECIRLQAKSLHSALKNGWKCSCQVPHLAALQLQERATVEWSSHFIMTFALTNDHEKIANPQRKVLVSVKQSKTIESSPSSRPQPTPVQDGFLSVMRSNFENSSDVGSSQWELPMQFKSRSISAPLSSIPNATTMTIMKTAVFNATDLVLNSNGHIVSDLGQITKIKKIVRMAVPLGEDLEHNNKQENLSQVSSAKPPPLSDASVPTLGKTEMEVEIEDLCSTLGKADPSLSCLGYLCDEEHRQYEFRSIKDNTAISNKYELISLEELLLKTTTLKITRKQRFRLTVVLASSLLQLQTTPWLTEKLSKKDIFFEYRGADVLADHPYVCYFFPSIKIPSPAPSEVEMSPNGTRFATRTSLANLGILLLELCFGEAIENRTDLRNNHLINGKPHNETDYLTALDWIYEVGEEAGLDFQDAIKCCFNFEVKPNWTDVKFTQSIYAGVVQPLENLVAELGWAGHP